MDTPSFDRILVIETSGKTGQVALASGDCVLAERSLPEARRHARDLALRCQELLDLQGWRALDLSAVVVNIGPGSYTGLRVGIASAKAICYAAKCPLLGVPAFEAIAAEIAAADHPLAIIADALQGQIYAELFQSEGNAWHSSVPLAIRSFDAWRDDLPPGTRIAGPGIEPFRSRLSENNLVIEPAEVHRVSSNLLKAARMTPSRWITNIRDLEPIYLRGSSAEEKRKMTETAQG